MKNISRRVFIKGMAVAAVATAASTVLTGCKLPVTPEEPVVETPSNQVITLTDEATDKSMTMTAKSFKYVEESKLAVVSLHLDNQLGAELDFDDSVTTKDIYFVSIAYKTTDKNGNVDASTATTDDTSTYVDNILASSSELTMFSKSSTDGYLYVTMPEAKKWEKLEVTVTLKKNYDASKSVVVAQKKFSFNK